MPLERAALPLGGPVSFSITVTRERGGMPSTADFLACSETCRDSVLENVPPAYSPVRDRPFTGTYTITEGRGRNARQRTYPHGGYRAVLRPVTVKTGPADRNGACHVCGSPVAAVRILGAVTTALAFSD